jgi:CubicO group peptidase (beta-lactamase class C family)
VVFPPGKGWQYSNTNYVLAGLIIQRGTGRSWQDEITRRIVRPLRLHNTTAPYSDPNISGSHDTGCRTMARCTEPLEIDSGHAPFLSHPAQLVELIRQLR